MAADPLGERPIVDPERVESLRSGLIERERGGTERFDLGLDPSDPENVEVELRELPSTARLGLLVPP